MHILLTNDDGIQSRALQMLFNVLKKKHRVSLIAPDREQSAVGHGITLRKPLRAQKVSLNGNDKGIAINGTPADCVKIGLLKLLDEKPDMVVSGINLGANVGIDITYSGTVAAAKEASFYGINAVAFSMVKRDTTFIEPQTDFIIRFLEKVRKHSLPSGTFLNVNFPNLPQEKIKGIKIAPHSLNFSKEYFDKRVDPKNQAYYWHVMSPRYDKTSNSDKAALYEDYITITPIKCDLTDYELLGNLSTWNIDLDDMM